MLELHGRTQSCYNDIDTLFSYDKDVFLDNQISYGLLHTHWYFAGSYIQWFSQLTRVLHSNVKMVFIFLSLHFHAIAEVIYKIKVTFFQKVMNFPSVVLAVSTNF